MHLKDADAFGSIAKGILKVI